MSFEDIASKMRKRADEKAADDTPQLPNFEELYRLRARILGVLIRDAREAADLSQPALADKISVSVATLSSWELGKAMPSLPQLELVAYALNMPISHFWGTEVMQRRGARELSRADEYVLLRSRLIGGLLRAAREKKNLTEEELATAAGISTANVTAYEMGERPIPTPVLVTLASSCNVNLNYFLENGNRVGTFLLLQEDMQNFTELPDEARHFLAAPVNQPYLELAMKLAKLGTNELRAIAEAILDITL